jgi:hypothetical protein
MPSKPSDSSYTTTPGLGIGAYGPGLSWSGPIDGDFRETVERLGVSEIALSSEGGEAIGSLDGLVELPCLTGLRLLPGRCLGDRDWRAIERLERLVYLSIGHDEVSGECNLSAFPRLEWLVMPWWPGVGGMDGVTLEGAWLRGLRNRGELGSLRPDRLRSLQVGGDVGCDLKALERFDGLRSLSVVGGKGLVDLGGVDRLESLEEIAMFGGRKLTRVTGLGGCAALRKVLLEDCPAIDEFNLDECRDLEAVWLLGGTKVRDGALQWIGEKGRLRHAFVVRRHNYDLDCDALPTVPVWEAYDKPPSYIFRPPVVRGYHVISRAMYGRDRMYPAWFRRDHPALCV